eukprot:CAMPEP_0117439636 /NCGR_PEP_ID=MMETSP0759-20121206/2666_1 /TAXON_ID=63605 /ORGANISM="Percolomonas cosmopolitus, Strain WS" /LENGTH=84 /DNA_ID=CAMNT_0005231355 /DNA_START=41 /DNA_END=295 /DNA_ORIENTATION=+
MGTFCTFFFGTLFGIYVQRNYKTDEFVSDVTHSVSSKIQESTTPQQATNVNGFWGTIQHMERKYRRDDASVVQPACGEGKSESI